LKPSTENTYSNTPQQSISISKRDFITVKEEYGSKQVFILPLLPPQNKSARNRQLRTSTCDQDNLLVVRIASFFSKVTTDPALPPGQAIGSINYSTILKQDDYYAGYYNIKFIF